MSLLVLPFPNFDPVAFAWGPFVIKWYGLSYLAGLVLGWIYIRRLLTEPHLWPMRKAPFEPSKVDDLLIYMTFGVILGGRLGFVLFYEPGYYLSHLSEVFAIWKGGMAFHGALLGSGAAIWLFAYRNGLNPFGVMDLVSAAVPIGLFFGRLANFINGELYGRPTSVPWAMIFPNAKLEYPSIEPTPRHPSQLYEAALEGIALFLVLRFMTHHRGALQTPGLITGIFLIGYGLARSLAELLRQPDPNHMFTVGPLTPGIAYSIPMIILGWAFIRWARTKAAE